jgi:N-methylhydantoinase A
MMGNTMSATLGVDVGGTFTDFFLADDASGEIRTGKLASTPDDPARAILEGLCSLVPAGGLAFLAHGTTIATNALLQRRGGKVALITTAGFKDLLEIGRQTRPKIYDLKADHPEPLVPREWRFEIPERIGAAGEVIRPLLATDLQHAIGQVRESRAESVAVCLLFSFLNPEHETRVGRALRAALPDLDVSLSAEVEPEFREYERLSTTVLNAFLQPVAGRYMARLAAAVFSHAPDARIGICQSSGGLMSIERATQMPIRTALSGPAAGVVGAVAAGGRSGRRDLITLDMGGTSTDVCLVRDGKPELAFGRSVAGFPVRQKSIDIHTIGAGGGSVAYIARDGLLRVGPLSAGADPGPACYGRGGSEPTVSDANLVLGRLPEELVGGGMRLYRRRAEVAIAPLARKLGLSLRETALGIVRIVNANMMRAIRAVSIERGHDPRAFTLMPFGGAGGLHAVEVARELDIPSILVPPAPGILCAEGVANSDLEESCVAGCRASLGGDLTAVAAQFARLIEAGAAWCRREGIAAADGAHDSSLDMRYIGQNFELAVPLPRGALLADAEWLKRAFHDAHQLNYGHHDRAAAIEIINVRHTARKLRTPRHRNAPMPTAGADTSTTRPVWFAADAPSATRFVERSALLPATVLEGPLVVTQFDATTLLPPGSRLSVEESGSMLIEVGK